MYKKGFFIEEPVGNNGFSYEQRPHKKIWVPAIKTITNIYDVELQDDKEKIAFEDFGFDDKLSTNYGLKNFYKIPYNGKEIYLFDNHNHALYFWYEAKNQGLIGKNAHLVHIDEHADMRDNDKVLSKKDSKDLEKVFYFTNYIANVGDYIVPAINNGLIGEVTQIRSTQSLEEYKEKFYGEKYQKNTDVILNLDLDFFQPDLDFIDYNLKKEVVLDAFHKAKVITICTSPFFIEQKLAIKVFQDLFSEVL